jgi:hypothetical protein
MLLQSIQQICRQDSEKLSKASEPGAVAYKVFELDIDDLEDFSHVDIRDSAKHKELFAALAEKEMRGPALYVFELLPDTDNARLLQQLYTYRSTAGSKAVPAMRKHPNTDSTYLYVGKVKKDFWGRLIQHMGFYKNGQTQGLQLYHWMRGSGAKLRVHVHVFPKGLEELMGRLEVQMAQQLHPLIGKHK